MIVDAEYVTAQPMDCLVFQCMCVVAGAEKSEL